MHEYQLSILCSVTAAAQVIILKSDIPASIMPNRNSISPEDDYFNDLSRQPSIRSNRSDSQERSTLLNELTVTQAGISRPKRIACIICRKRKLKCDGSKPSCGTCSRLGHKCAYDEVRRKSGPKRGYVKELEARLGMSIDRLSCSSCSKSD